MSRTHNDVSGAQHEIRCAKRLKGIQTPVNIGDDLGSHENSYLLRRSH